LNNIVGLDHVVVRRQCIFLLCQWLDVNGFADGKDRPDNENEQDQITAIVYLSVPEATKETFEWRKIGAFELFELLIRVSLGEPLISPSFQIGCWLLLIFLVNKLLT
jgi:hypothetical protein